VKTKQVKEKGNMILTEDAADRLAKAQIQIDAVMHTHLGGAYYPTVRLEPPLQIGQGIFDVGYMGAFTHLQGEGHVLSNIASIGRFCTIGARLKTLSAMPVATGLSTRAQVLDGTTDLVEPVAAATVIGHDVWIGDDVRLYNGIHIGHGVMIESGALVTTHLPPYAIVSGVPATIVGYRFDAKRRAQLLNSRWWAYGLPMLSASSDQITDAGFDGLIYKIKQGAPIYAPQLWQVDVAGDVKKIAPDVVQITAKAPLDVTVNIGAYALCLDFNDAHERAQYYSERSDIPTLNTLIARQFVQQGDHVLDAGANIGYTSLHYLACGAALVHAIEPARSYFDRLERLASADLHVYNVAVGHVNRVLPLYLSALHRQGNTLNPAMLNYFPSAFKGAQTDTQMTQVLRCDDIFDHVRLNMMKIDIEGFEIECIKGALTCLAQPALRLVQVALYDRFFFEADQLLSPLFEYVYRAVIDPLSKQLKVMRLDDPQIKALQEKLPMYLYSKHPLSIH
jgi:FkbM family methyltransferase